MGRLQTALVSTNRHRLIEAPIYPSRHWNAIRSPLSVPLVVTLWLPIFADIAPQAGRHYRPIAISLRFADFTLIWNAERIARVLGTTGTHYPESRFHSPDLLVAPAVGKRCATYLGNLCPIHCSGAASHSRRRTTILHSEGGDCKRLCENLTTNFERPPSRRFGGSLCPFG